MSEHLERPPASAEALSEMSHVVEAVIGVPNRQTVGIACALVQVDPATSETSVTGSTWATRDEDLDDVRFETKGAFRDIEAQEWHLGGPAATVS